MTMFIEFIKEWWEVLSGLAVLIGWLYTLYRNHRDSEAILCFLKQPATDTAYSFRSTEAIASKTNLTESRVESLCSKHPKIRRNTKEKQSWSLNP